VLAAEDDEDDDENQPESERRAELGSARTETGASTML